MSDTNYVALTGKDTIALNGVQMNNLGPGDCFVGEFPNDLVKISVGKNGNVAAALDASGQVFETTIDVLRGSPEDIYLIGQLAAIEQDLPSFKMMTGNFVKRIGDGQGGVTQDSYVAANGVVKRKPGVKENVAGDTAQAIRQHRIVFGKCIIAVF